MIDYIWVGAIVTSPIWILASLCIWEHIKFKRNADGTNSGSKFG